MDKRLNYICMKIFSFKKLVSFQDGKIVVEDLAYNHPYRKENDQLVSEGYDKETRWNYKVLFSLEGELKLVILDKHNFSKALLPIKKEYDIYETQKIKPNGDVFSVVSKYLTTSKIEKKLVAKSFLLQIGDKEQTKNFVLEDKGWRSEGNIAQELRLVWQ